MDSPSDRVRQSDSTGAAELPCATQTVIMPLGEPGAERRLATATVSADVASIKWTSSPRKLPEAATLGSHRCPLPSSSQRSCPVRREGEAHSLSHSLRLWPRLLPLALFKVRKALLRCLLRTMASAAFSASSLAQLELSQIVLGTEAPDPGPAEHQQQHESHHVGRL